MKKILVVMAIVVGLILYGRKNGSPPVYAPQKSSATVTATGRPQTGMGAFKDGIYVGPVTDAYYGNIQVKATVTNGKLTNVEFLQYPNDRENSIRINSQAMPLLTYEAIQAQSGKVDVVSGATDTSRAFVDSLSTALSQAVIL